MYDFSRTLLEHPANRPRHIQTERDIVTRNVRKRPAMTFELRILLLEETTDIVFEVASTRGTSPLPSCSNDTLKPYATEHECHKDSLWTRSAEWSAAGKEQEPIARPGIQLACVGRGIVINTHLDTMSCSLLMGRK